MSLIKCPECGKEFSEFARECPTCGMPTNKINVGEQNDKKEVIKKNEPQRAKKKNQFFTKTVLFKIIGSIIAFIILNLVLISDTTSVTFGGLLLLNAFIGYAIGFIFTDWKWAFIPLVIFLMVLTMFHKLIPTIDVIDINQTHEERYAIYFHTITPDGETHFLAPTGDYIYNKTGRTLYLTSVGYGEYKFEPNKHTTIYSNTIVKGKIDVYFQEPSSSTIVRGGHVDGVWRNYLDFKQY